MNVEPIRLPGRVIDLAAWREERWLDDEAYHATRALGYVVLVIGLGTLATGAAAVYALIGAWR